MEDDILFMFFSSKVVVLVVPEVRKQRRELCVLGAINLPVLLGDLEKARSDGLGMIDTEKKKRRLWLVNAALENGDQLFSNRVGRLAHLDLLVTGAHVVK